MDPVILCALSCFGLFWSVVGYALIWTHIAPMAPTVAARFLVGLAAGPLVWSLQAYRALGQLRKRILGHFGVGSYTCGCGCHGPDSGHGIRVADNLANQPATR